MKLRIVFLVMVVTSAGTLIAQVKTITPESAERRIKKGNVMVLDVRTPEEFNAGHLPQAINYNVLDSIEFLQQIRQLNKEKTYVVYCKSGKRSTAAVKLMQQAGFVRVWNMKGGITAWKGKTE